MGRFGRAKFRYLQKCHRILLTNLRVNGSLNEYLHEVDVQCEETFSQMVKQLAEQENVTEQLKADDMMSWVGKMNNIRSRAEEIVLKVPYREEKQKKLPPKYVNFKAFE